MKLLQVSHQLIKLPKAQLHKLVQSGGVLGRLSEPLLKIGLFLMKNVLKQLAKSVLIPSGLTTAAVAATDGAIQKKIFELRMTTLIILNEEMK